jgi:hypothetical protein
MENVFDLAFLLGPTFVSVSFLNKGDSLTKIIPHKSSPFLRNLPSILSKLRSNSERMNLASALHIPNSVLKLKLQEREFGGICYLCDKYVMRLNWHIMTAHELTQEQYSELQSLLLVKGLFYLPKEIRHNDRRYEKCERDGEKAVYYSAFGDGRGYYLVNKREEISESINKCMICEECGKIVNGKEWKIHVKQHELCRVVECSKCGVVMRRREMNNHRKKCRIRD